MEKIISNIIDVIKRFPVSVLCTIFCVLSSLPWSFIAISIAIDIVVNYAYVFWEMRRFNQVLKNKFLDKSENAQVIDDDLIKALNNESYLLAKSYYDILSGLFDIYRKVVVWKQDGLSQYTTISNAYGTSIISVSNSYTPNDIKSIARLSHEYAHTYHSLFRQGQWASFCSCVIYFIPIYCYYVFHCLKYDSLYYAISSLVILIVIALLLRLFHKTVNHRFESFVETNADLLALQFIEKIKGKESMHEAAECLLTIRIDSLLKNRDNKYAGHMAQSTIMSSINCLLHYIDEEKKTKLKEKYTKQKDTLLSMCKNEAWVDDETLLAAKNKCLRLQILLSSLEKVNHIETSFGPTMYPITFFEIVIFACQLGIICWTALHTSFSFSGNLFIWLCVASIILITISTIIFNINIKKIWNNQKLLMQKLNLL